MKTLITTATAVGLAFASIPAQAAPFFFSPGSGAPIIEQAAFGCGGGWTRGPYGHCRPRFTCPPGFHSGPYGYHCFPNRW